MIGLHVNHCHYTDGLVSLVFCEYRSNATFFECELVLVEGGVSFGEPTVFQGVFDIFLGDEATVHSAGAVFRD